MTTLGYDLTNYCELANKENQTFINLNDIIYLTHYTGWLYYSQLSNLFDDFIILINTPHEIHLKTLLDKKTISLPPGIHLVNHYMNMEITKDCQVIVIKHNIHQTLCIPCLQKKIDIPMENGLFSMLFDSIALSENPENEIITLANKIKAKIQQCDIHNDYEKIRKTVLKHCKNPKFNLDLVCAHVYMSRRKIQYILSENNLTFINLTRQCRLSELKLLFQQQPESSIEDLAKQCGFRNVGMAKRAFQKRFNYSLK